MKVRLHPGDQRGVGFNRMTWPGQAAHADGVDVEFADGLPILRDQHDRVVGVEPVGADVLVFQRVSNPDLLAAIPLLQERGYAVVVDVDDDLQSVPKRNVAAGAESHPDVMRACAHADLVTVTTPSLAKIYAPHGRVRVLPNCVPEATLYLPRDSDGRTVGWGGWTGSHPGDLQATRGAVADAVREADARFHVVGPADGIRAHQRVQEFLGLAKPPTATGALTDVAGFEFERALGELDVGIVPLADTKFNRSKSRLKGLQYAARGVAFVASQNAEYRLLAADGIGLLASTRGRWRSRILDLLNDEQYRFEIAEGAKAVVAEYHTYEGNSWRWAEAWQDAFERRHAVGRTAVAA